MVPCSVLAPRPHPATLTHRGGQCRTLGEAQEPPGAESLGWRGAGGGQGHTWFLSDPLPPGDGISAPRTSTPQSCSVQGMSHP